MIYQPRLTPCRRQSTRWRALRHAKAFSDRYPRGVVAIVKNMSDDGCLLVGGRVDYLGAVGNRVRIEAREGMDNVIFDCQIRWRAQKRLGLVFLNVQYV